MKNQEKLISNIKANKKLLKNIEKSFYGNDLNGKIQMFINNANRYIKATEQKRVFCIIYKVSASGMSRNLAFFEHVFDSKYKQGHIYNFHSLFKSLGHTEAKEGFRINGCGMNMVFHTNYTIIHELNRLGFNMNCASLAQNTPTTL